MKIYSAPGFEAEARRWGRSNIDLIGKKLHGAVSRAIYEGVVQRTPVLTSLARGNWVPTVGAPGEGVTSEVAGVSTTGQPLTPAEKTKGKTFQTQLEALPLGHATSHVTNNLHYISKLEDGHSPKAPPGAMTQQTIINTLDGLKVEIILAGVR